MKNLTQSLLLSCILLLSGSVRAQHSSSASDPIYGLDPKLFNGIRYAYYPGASVKGNQYLLSPEFIDGSLTIQGKQYRDVRLNYDIYNQELLLKFQDANSSSSILQVSKAWLTAFSLGGKQFISLPVPAGFAFYQVYGNAPMQILVAWKKDLAVEQGNSVMTFSKPFRTFYLCTDRSIQPFSNKKSFISSLPESLRPKIRKYMQVKKIRFRRITEEQLNDLAAQLATP